MAILEALVGGIVGTVSTLLATEVRRSFTERETAVLALGAELSQNLRVACDILNVNTSYFGESSGSDPWWELVAFSGSSWSSVVSGGLISRIDSSVIEPLAKSYVELRKADYSAGKLQSGRVDFRKAAEYTVRVYDAGVATSAALLSLREHKGYRGHLERLAQLENSLALWTEKADTWKEKVDSVRRKTG